MLVCLLGNEKLRSRVGVEDLVVDLWGDLEERGEVLLSGVGHDNVETAKGLLALLEELDDVRDHGDVGLDGDSVGAELLDLLDDGVGIVGGLSVVDDDFGATGGELKSDTTADTTAGTGDKGYLALERRC